MAPLKVLICGGGIAGPSVALWLARCGHKVTIIERNPVLRASGAQIDIRAQGIRLVRRMGLMDAIRCRVVNEAGMALLNEQNRVIARMGANTSGKGAQALTSEYEIMRGDLVRILYDATKDDVEYVFGKTVESFEQDENGVTVQLSDGTTDRYDLLVGADGQGSRIRRSILPAGALDPIRRLGLFVAYWFVPSVRTDDKFAKGWLFPGSRAMMCRNHSPTESNVTFVLRADSEELRSMPRASVQTQKEFWSQKFRDVGGQSERFIEGMKTTDSFYCHEFVQVQTDTWYQGRVVLLADAAHCPSPATGMGTTSALVSAYVLAGELSQNAHDIPQALANYHSTLRPFVDEIQKVYPALIRLILPETRFGVAIFYFLMQVLCFLRIPELAARFAPEDTGSWPLPDYPHLGLDRC